MTERDRIHWWLILYYERSEHLNKLIRLEAPACIIRDALKLADEARSMLQAQEIEVLKRKAEIAAGTVESA